MVRVESGTTSTLGDIRVQYSTDESTWNYLTANGSNYPTVSLGSTGTKNSGKEAIVSGAQALVYLRLITTSGDGTTNSNASFGNITLGTIYDL
jgi:hypothetical protein